MPSLAQAALARSGHTRSPSPGAAAARTPLSATGTPGAWRAPNPAATAAVGQKHEKALSPAVLSWAPGPTPAQRPDAGRLHKHHAGLTAGPAAIAWPAPPVGRWAPARRWRVGPQRATAADRNPSAGDPRSPAAGSRGARNVTGESRVPAKAAGVRPQGGSALHLLASALR